jgi:hypothetical protein
MAIGRISGQMLQSNLLRSGQNLAFETSLLALDVVNSRVGVGTASPQRQLHINGTGALRLPSGTSGERGGSANGDIRYNTTINTIEGYSNGTWVNLATGSSVKDIAGTTGIDVERTSNDRTIDFYIGGIGDVAHMRSDGTIELNNLQISGQTITGLSTNADINLTTNGTGNINLNGTGIRVGDQNTNTTVTTYGTADLTLNTNSGTNSGSIKIANGSGGNISILNNGAGKLLVSGPVSTNGAANLVLSTNSGTNSGSITINNGTNGDITIATNGSGKTNINSSVIVSGDLTVNGVTTTVNSTTVTVADPLLVMGAGNSGGSANTFDQGLLITRGSNENQAFIWREVDSEFAAVATTETGNTAGSINIDAYANFHAARITGSHFVTSALDISTNKIEATGTGNVDIELNPLNSGTVKIDKANITGGTINGTTIGASTAASGKFTTVDASGNISLNSNTNKLRIGSSQQIQIYHDGTDAHVSNTTGILKIDGQTTSSIKINAAAADVDFIVQGQSNNNLFFVDAENNKIGISTATPGYILDAGSSTNAIKLPQGNSSTRPSPSTGVIRFNTETGYYEGCTDGSNWTTFGTTGTGGTPVITKLSATGDGSTSTFVGFFADAPASSANILVFIDNVYQEPETNYTVSGTDLQITEAPYAGARIFAIVGFDNTALVTGGVLRTQTTGVSFGSSPTDIMTFNQTSYRSAELFVQVDDGAGAYSVIKASVVHNGSTAAIQTYGGVDTGSGQLATLTVTHDASTVHVKANTASGTYTAKVQYTLSPV